MQKHMSPETRNCQNCKSDFVIEPDDFSFYEKMKVPPPTFCPECRMIRRLPFRNERTLYKRQCDLCKEDKIMMYPKDAPFPVYCYPCWWSDGWDAHTFARSYDFTRSFFEQFQELINAVPRPGIIKQGNSIDSEYTNRVTDQRRCYLVYGSINNEDCRYSVWINDSKQVFDCYNVAKSERCNECVDCYQCSGLAFSQECQECLNSWFLFNCRNCSDCIGCVNLRNKKYCIFNVEYSKEEYYKKVAELALDTKEGFEKVRAQFEDVKRNAIMPWAMNYHTSHVTGNWITNSKNLKCSFNCDNVEEGRYLYGIVQGKDVMDYWQWSAGSEKVYEAINVGRQCSNLKFVNECWDQLRDSEYSTNCHSSHNLFGCCGIRKGEYSILNKQYSEAEYFEMVEKIKAQMDRVPYVDAGGRTYRYGEFFPIEISPFAYNETIAQEFFPITKDEAGRNGYIWRASEERNYSITLRAEEVPFSSEFAADDIANAIISCGHEGACGHQCTTAFRILKDDLVMYKLAKLPLPRLCPNCRHFERHAKRNPLKLWKRKCMCVGAKSGSGVHANTGTHTHGVDHCPNEFETSYSPDRPEIVYCEQCYQAEVA